MSVSVRLDGALTRVGHVRWMGCGGARCPARVRVAMKARKTLRCSGTGWRGLEFPRSAKAVRKSLKATIDPDRGGTPKADGGSQDGYEQQKIGGAVFAPPLRATKKRSLSGAAVRLWLELHTRYSGGNNGTLTLSYTEGRRSARNG